ncbi:MAG: nickel-dependent lactate racemase [Planctomycetes bacterium]|nr:nickel-dependent lactate racemase [Planctomycetota bacterium]
MKTVDLAYGRTPLVVRLPDSAQVLRGPGASPLARPEEEVLRALSQPIGGPPLAKLIRARRPQTVAITVSDITRPVPNRLLLLPMLDVLNRHGIDDSQVVVVVGTGMHRESTPEELDIIVGREILDRVEVIDHLPRDAASLVEVSRDPPVSVNRRFAQADLRIVTGLIEPHFMAGFSGGRKGVCPALVDLETVQRFHGYETLAHPQADTGRLDGNPCHDIALAVARTVGVDFLVNVAITHDRRLAGVFAGDLVAAHEAGCRKVDQWVTAEIDGPFDLVVTCGGGYPLDQTFYQTVKGMVTALPALAPGSTLLQASHCGEGIGSQAYSDLMLTYDNDWRRFLADAEAHKDRTLLDQWQYQMQARVLQRIGMDRLLFISDGIPPQTLRRLSVTAIEGPQDATGRLQATIDRYVADHPTSRIAVIPEGPYTPLRIA